MFYLIPESGTRKKLVRDCITHVPDSGTRIWYRFLVRISWALGHFASSNSGLLLQTD